MPIQKGGIVLIQLFEGKLCQKCSHPMDDLEVAQFAVDAFLNKDKSLLPECDYLMPQVRELQGAGRFSFEEILSRIDPRGSLRDAALLLGQCERKLCTSIGECFLESMKLFCEVEARIRFSLWPAGVGAPHHFSKLLNTRKVRELFSESEILVIRAIFADEKGLNLRNITTHGLCFDPSLSLSLLIGLQNLIFPRLSDFHPREFNFERELQLFEFHNFRLSFSPSLSGARPSIFPVLDSRRLACVNLAYTLFDANNFVDALLLLFPIFEHSLRRAAISLLKLPIRRLCASSEEHFLSVKECCCILPQSLQSMVHELLTAPDGPRLRDRIMHGAVREVPRGFATALFVLFEKCVDYFECGSIEIMWDLVFHPARCLEYELSKVVNLKRRLDFVKVYNPRVYERLIESAVLAQSFPENRFKDLDCREFVGKTFGKFICLCILYFAGEKVPNSAIQNLLALAHAPGKYGEMNDVDRFRLGVCNRVAGIQKFLPFIRGGSTCSYDDVVEMANDVSLLDSAVDFLEKRIAGL
jgi:hypothetical protein